MTSLEFRQNIAKNGDQEREPERIQEFLKFKLCVVRIWNRSSYLEWEGRIIGALIGAFFFFRQPLVSLQKLYM